GRAEIMAGRGSFIESFPLFGYNLRDYDKLFEEKLDLLLKINTNEKVSWAGELRPALDNLGVYPRPYQQALPVWLAVGGAPAPAVRAARPHLPPRAALSAGMPERSAPFLGLSRPAAAEAGFNDPIAGLTSHSFVAEPSQQAASEFFPSYSELMNRIGR